jgi:hypothetical protein
MRPRRVDQMGAVDSKFVKRADTQVDEAQVDRR